MEYDTKNKKSSKKRKQKQTHRYRQQIGGYQRGSEAGKGEIGKGDEIYDGSWKLDFWW